MCVRSQLLQRLVRDGFGGGVHAVLGDFVDAAGGGLNALAVEMIERNAALADGVALFDGLSDVGFGESRGFEQSAACCQLRGQRRSKTTAGSVRIVCLHAISTELDHFGAVK